jgi:hypothetical protein
VSRAGTASQPEFETAWPLTIIRHPSSTFDASITAHCILDFKKLSFMKGIVSMTYIDEWVCADLLLMVLTSA